VEIVKYILLSAGGYIYVVVSLFVFVDFFEFNERVSYFMIYFLAYLFDYVLTMRFIFQKEHRNIVLLKYLIYLGIFFLLNNMLYGSILYFGTHYVIASVFVIMILFPLRFLTIKFVVFK
jgi:putative flippase GtrA